ncbi:MAG: hypothetical protein IIZ40_03900 [Bacilli bacterium]|nr:hypothetical protein [Bacilli bacterium]
MKKILFLILNIFLIAKVLFSKYDNAISMIQNNINTKLNECSVVRNIDTHSGFHNDGYKYVELSCSDKSKEILKEIKKWNKLPLTSNLNDIVYLSNSISTFDLPDIKNGYYYFYDKQIGSRNETNIENKKSYNFYLVLYDIDTNKLYYIELDT